MSTKQVKSAEKRKPPAAGRGRVKGTKNKVTVAIKDAIQNAFTKVGGADYLVTVAENDPRTFCALLGRVLPTEVTAQVTGALTILSGVPRADDR
jgi:hypothetical protein